MDSHFEKLAKFLQITSQCLLGLLFCAVIVSVFLRYLISVGSVKMADLQHYAFGCLILLSVVVAFANDRHVKLSLRASKDDRSTMFQRVWLLFLVLAPMCVIAYTAAPTVLASWNNMEGSPEPDGLGGLFLVKIVLPLMAILMILLAVQKMFQRKIRKR